LNFLKWECPSYSRGNIQRVPQRKFQIIAVTRKIRKSVHLKIFVLINKIPETHKQETMAESIIIVMADDCPPHLCIKQHIAPFSVSDIGFYNISCPIRSNKKRQLERKEYRLYRRVEGAKIPLLPYENF